MIRIRSLVASPYSAFGGEFRSAEIHGIGPEKVPTTALEQESDALSAVAGISITFPSQCSSSSGITALHTPNLT